MIYFLQFFYNKLDAKFIIFITFLVFNVYINYTYFITYSSSLFCNNFIMSLFDVNNIVIMLSVVGSIIGSIKCVSDYLENREKEIRRLVAVSCEYTYMTYIKNIKKRQQLTDEHKLIAINITKNFFRNKCSYIISDKLLTIYIEERITYINDIVKKKENDNK